MDQTFSLVQTPRSGVWPRHICKLVSSLKNFPETNPWTLRWKAIAGWFCFETEPPGEWFVGMSSTTFLPGIVGHHSGCEDGTDTARHNNKTGGAFVARGTRQLKFMNGFRMQSSELLAKWTLQSCGCLPSVCYLLTLETRTFSSSEHYLPIEPIRIPCLDMDKLWDVVRLKVQRRIWCHVGLHLWFLQSSIQIH